MSRILLLLAIVLVPYSNIEWPHGGWIGGGTLFLGVFFWRSYLLGAAGDI